MFVARGSVDDLPLGEFGDLDVLDVVLGADERLEAREGEACSPSESLLLLTYFDVWGVT